MWAASSSDKLTRQPGPRESEISLHGGEADADSGCDFFERLVAEIPALHDRGDTRIISRESGQGSVQRVEAKSGYFATSGRHHTSHVVKARLLATPALVGVVTPRVIDELPAHPRGHQPEKRLARIESNRCAVKQPKVRLVHESCWLKRVIESLPSKIPARDAAHLVVCGVDQTVYGVAVTLAPTLE